MTIDPSRSDMIAPGDAAAMRKWAKRLKEEARIDVLRVAGHPAMAAVEGFAAALEALAPRVKVSRRSDPDPARPGLRIAPNLIFYAAPRGTELPAFLDALAMAAGQTAPRLSTGHTQALGKIGAPAQLDLYVSPHCPFCPIMVARLSALALAAPKLSLAVIDAGLFAEAARDHEIRSVPTLILDGGLRWTGEAGIDEILPAITARDPARLGAAVLERMLESGAAGDLAAMMMAAGRIFPALVDLLVQERFSVRLGAMVTLETLAEEAPELAATLAPELIARYGAQGVAVRGDILQMLGMLGGAELVGPIMALTRDEADADIREAAAEAIATLKGPPSPGG